MKITNDVYLVFSVLKLIVTWVLSKKLSSIHLLPVIHVRPLKNRESLICDKKC